MSPGVYIGFLQAFEFVHRHAGKLQMPTLLQLAGQDTVVSNVDSEKFFEKLGSPLKIKKIYHDSYHEIYNDLERASSFSDILEFIRPFSNR
jgi:alpha-beta hydrolase superfamily lysophospholipase